jgi:hypothetical protein
VTTHYPEIWAALQRLDETEKTASVSSDASRFHADRASMVFDLFMSKAASYNDVATAAGAAKAAAAFGFDLVDSARATNTKVAAEDLAGRSLEKLATVAFLDRVLEDAMAKTAGDESEKIAYMRLMGREFGIEILRSLVG